MTRWKREPGWSAAVAAVPIWGRCFRTNNYNRGSRRDEGVAEETFGPVVSVYSFGSEQEAMDRANATLYGLSASTGRGMPEGRTDRAGDSRRQRERERRLLSGLGLSRFADWGYEGIGTASAARRRGHAEVYRIANHRGAAVHADRGFLRNVAGIFRALDDAAAESAQMDAMAGVRHWAEVNTACHPGKT